MNWSGFLQLDTAHANPMHFSSKRTCLVFSLIILVIGTCFCQSPSKEQASSHPETLAVLPFETHGLTHEEGILLCNRFAEVVRESKRFDVLATDSTGGSVGLHDSRSLAKAAKILGVRKIVHVSVVHRDRLYVLQIRLINVGDAALLYAERVDYSGEFGSFLSDVIPEQARKLTQAHLDAKTPWAKAAFLFGACLGAIIWILWHLRRKGQQQGRGPSSNETAREEEGLLT
jgi:TolB-like protein